jgi:hypothetical protein
MRLVAVLSKIILLIFAIAAILRSSRLAIEISWSGGIHG